MHVSHRILPASVDALIELAEKSGESQGEVLDRLIAKEYKRVMKVG